MRLLTVSFSFFCIYFLNASTAKALSFAKTDTSPGYHTQLNASQNKAPADFSEGFTFLVSESIEFRFKTVFYAATPKFLILNGVRDFYIFSGLSPPLA